MVFHQNIKIEEILGLHLHLIRKNIPNLSPIIFYDIPSIVESASFTETLLKQIYQEVLMI